jgi:signal transduction histidine kinase
MALSNRAHPQSTRRLSGYRPARRGLGHVLPGEYPAGHRACWRRKTSPAAPPYAERVSRLARWFRRDSAVRDAVTALVVTVVLTYGAYGESHPQRPDDQVLNGHHAPAAPAAAYLLVVAACLVLAAKRRYPLGVLAASTAAVMAYSALGYVNGSVILAPGLALYWAAKARPARESLAAAAVTLIGLGAAAAAGNPFGIFGGGFILIPAEVAVAVIAGIAVRNRAAYVQQRAQDEARRRVDEERLRIARELHDVVAHTMSTINVQAAMAAHVLAEQPAMAAEALQVIRLASKDGLRELRVILNLLRQADEGDPVQPVPGLGQLEGLVARARGGGLPVTVRQWGGARRLAAPVDLTAYRIIQESLTNVIRHAGAATAAVVIGYEPSELRISVTDTGSGPGTGPGAGGGSGGLGLIGMRERAAAVGGTVECGAGVAGGFRVSAVLPAPPVSGEDLLNEAARAGAEAGRLGAGGELGAGPGGRP